MTFSQERGKAYELPLIGDLADKLSLSVSVDEDGYPTFVLQNQLDGFVLANDHPSPDHFMYSGSGVLFCEGAMPSGVTADAQGYLQPPKDLTLRVQHFTITEKVSEWQYPTHLLEFYSMQGQRAIVLVEVTEDGLLKPINDQLQAWIDSAA